MQRSCVSWNCGSTQNTFTNITNKWSKQTVLTANASLNPSYYWWASYALTTASTTASPILFRFSVLICKQQTVETTATTQWCEFSQRWQNSQLYNDNAKRSRYSEWIQSTSQTIRQCLLNMSVQCNIILPDLVLVWPVKSLPLWTENKSKRSGHLQT